VKYLAAVLGVVTTALAHLWIAGFGLVPLYVIVKLRPKKRKK
jgi:hypothetical protein